MQPTSGREVCTLKWPSWVLPGEEYQKERISKTLSTWLSQPAVEGAAAGFWPLADSQGLQQAILLIGSYLFTAKANGFH